MKRCENCGSVYLHKPVGDKYCTIGCLRFKHNDGVVDSIHHIISKLKDYNEDQVPELDTMDKIIAYKEHKALVD